MEEEEGRRLSFPGIFECTNFARKKCMDKSKKVSFKNVNSILVKYS